MVLFTDGLVNARLPHGDRLGDEAVAEVVRESAHLSSSEIVQTLFAVTDERAEIDDDVVILTLKRPSQADEQG